MNLVSPVYALILLRHFERQGMSVARLLQRTGLSPDSLRLAPELSQETFYQVLDNARSEVGAELGFLMGRYTNVLTLGRLGMAMGVAPNLRAALRVVETYTRLHTSYTRVKLGSTLEGLLLTVIFSGVPEELELAHAQAGLMLLQNFAEEVHGRPLQGIRFQFAHGEPEDGNRYREEFHGEIEFDSEAHGILFPTAALDEPSPYYDVESWRDLQLELAQLLNTARQSESQAYTRHVGAYLRSCEPPLPELAEVAVRLNVSERTLNRRLRQEGSSFRELRLELLQTWARRYLSRTEYSVEAIASLLGYQDAANFRRAFKKRQGCTPVDYRSRHPETDSVENG